MRRGEQVVSGVGLDAYWLSSYLWDAGFMILLVGFTLVVLAASDVEALMDGEAVGATFLLFLMYSISMVRIGWDRVYSGSANIVSGGYGKK